MVVYKALYGDGDIWIRPYDMFIEEVKIDGKTVDRFKLVKCNSKKKSTLK